MRLLRRNSQDVLVLTEDLVDNIPRYAILSHTWGADNDEVTFTDIQKNQGRGKVGFAKIQFCEERARRDGIEYFWVDTCCINKDSHVELSEAITSMFHWYECAAKCYVFLCDVSILEEDIGSTSAWESDFQTSRWFTRGWTLQELLAPRIVEFFSREKTFLGDKITLAQQIHKTTNIPLAALKGTALTQFSVTERMRWAHERNTKKREDKAYCLLGIFQVFMPLIYGEGDNAFTRLQAEIQKQSSWDRANPPENIRHAACEELEAVRSLGLCMGLAPLISSDDFVGRAAEIDEIYSLLQPDSTSLEQRRVVLGGMGGIGKTQMAIAYARCYQQSYGSVIWLNATTSSTLYTSIRSVGRAFIKAASLAALDDEQVLAQTHEWLSHPQNTRWLLIFDNYDDPDQFSLENFCPNTGCGSIIVTTRLPDLVMGQQIRLQPLRGMEDGLRILQTRSGRRDVKNDVGAQRLVERLGGLPLALTTAGAYLRRTNMTFQAYLDTYERSWKIDPRRPFQLREYQDRTLYTTWNLSYRRLLDDDPDAANMLKLLAYFDHQELWYGLFHAGLSDESPPWLRASVSEETSFESVMGTLVEYCLLELQYTTRSYSLHNCVHDWTLGELNSTVDPQLYGYVFNCIARSISDRDWDALAQVRYARLVRHAVRLSRDHFRPCDGPTDGMSDRFIDALWITAMLRDHGQVDEAERLNNRTLVRYKEALASDQGATIQVVHSLGLLYRNQKKFQEAEQMYVLALAGYERSLGPNHPLTLDAASNLGLLQYRQGKLDEAEQMYKRALLGREKVLGSDHVATLNVLNNLALLYSDQDKMEDVEQMYERALAGYERSFGHEHVSTLDCAYNLGRLYYEQGRLDKAEQMYCWALAGYEKILGPEHRTTLKTIYIVGLVYDQQGNFEKTEQMYERAISGFEKALGPDHSLTLSAIFNLGHLYHADAKFDEAEPLLQYSLLRWTEVHGQDEPQVQLATELLDQIRLARQGKKRKIDDIDVDS